MSRFASLWTDLIQCTVIQLQYSDCVHAYNKFMLTLKTESFPLTLKQITNLSEMTNYIYNHAIKLGF